MDFYIQCILLTYLVVLFNYIGYLVDDDGENFAVAIAQATLCPLLVVLAVVRGYVELYRRAFK